MMSRVPPVSTVTGALPARGWPVARWVKEVERKAFRTTCVVALIACPTALPCVAGRVCVSTGAQGGVDTACPRSPAKVPLATSDSWGGAVRRSQLLLYQSHAPLPWVALAATPLRGEEALPTGDEPAGRRG